MRFPSTTIVLFLSALLLGLRHGVDWDHIAAIADITGTGGDKKRSFILGSIYALGHASVIIVLGLLAVLIGVSLPDWVDNVMEPVVGITLILLGFYLIYTILRHGKNFRMRSRWMMIFALVGKLYDSLQEKISHKHEHPHIKYPDTYGIRTAYMVGVIHGIGAETPTQVLIFITAAGVGGSLLGTLLVFTFVAGLLTSNTLITLASTLGFAKTAKNSNISIVLGVITAIFSLIVGSLFLLHKVSFLPAILGG
ncbi:hypothetical protein HZB96_04625 [Candidatus Gottesmanbacteria bacterium]|nr:hypothetical protein [Candidatus Gottesmanbacteria bacterium]